MGPLLAGCAPRWFRSWECSQGSRTIHVVQNSGGKIYRASAPSAERRAWGGLAEVHEDIFAAHLDRVGLHAHGGVYSHFSGGDVVLPAVPRAGDGFVFELTLAQRPAAVQAGVVDRVELAVHVGQRDGLAIHLEFADGPGGDFVFLRGTQESHAFTPFSWEWSPGDCDSPSG